MKETPWSRIKGHNSVDKEFLEIVGNGNPTGSAPKEDNCTFGHDIYKRGKITQSNTSPNSFMQQYERKSSRTRSPRGRSPSGRMSRWPCKDYLRGTCTNSFCEKWHPPECLFCKTKSGCRYGEKCSYAQPQFDEQPSKWSKKNDDKSAVANATCCHELKRGPVGRRSSNARQLGCVFQDMKPPKSILRKSSDMQKPIQRVRFTKAIARHTKIRDPKSFARIYLPR